MKVSYVLALADQGIFHNADGRGGEESVCHDPPGVSKLGLLALCNKTICKISPKVCWQRARKEIWKHMAPQITGEMAVLADLVITS